MTRLSTCIPALALLLAACPSDSAGDDDVGATESEESTESTTGETETDSLDAPESVDETDTTTGGEPRPARLLITSDWRAKRLSLIDYAAIRDGATTRDEALWKTIDLPDFEPGPLEAEISPDGATLVVAISPGFFAGPAGTLAGAGPGAVPEGGTLLIVDVDSGEVVDNLDTAHYPMGIAITDDGGRALTANYGGNGQSGTTMSLIDLTAPAILAEYEVGPSPEQIDLDGGLGIVNTAGDGSVRLFGTNDPDGTLGSPLMVSDDPSWVLLIGPGDTRAVAINSVGPPGYSLVDVGDPQNPTLVETQEITGIPYAGAHGTTETEIVLTALVGNAVSIQRFDTATGTLVDQIDAPVSGFPLGLVFEPDDALALVPVPGANVLIVADFATGEHREIPWQDVPGPTYVALEDG